ncbi:MAG: hypothetical protein L0H54_07535 [Alcaligenaceae bacterium]|nr:hypothetical protein [Alcaligenaceae bacterium]
MKVVLLDEAQSDIRELRQYVTKIFGKAIWQETYTGIKATRYAIRWLSPSAAISRLNWLNWGYPNIDRLFQV